MSLYWSQWMPQFWNQETLTHLRDQWNANVVRCPMGVRVEDGGYLAYPEREYDKMKTVIEAAINVIYVIVDWHEEKAYLRTQQAIQFFKNISKTYGSCPHIIYEIWNEPTGVNWITITTYAQQVIPAIRENDLHNIIVVGTPNWSQDVDIAVNSPLNYSNVAYTLHYYAGIHKQALRNKATVAISKGLPIFITEYGTTNVQANGTVDVEESQLWWQFNDKNKLSYCNWAIDIVQENTAALISGTTAAQVGDSSRWTVSGKLVNKKLQSTDQGLH
uniref:Glycoside hydrolase family 5 domain-containing protein n=1 Tax=Acrobeloides nanus TaxID=290746 RepID=A0A914ECA8_9BILA